MANNTNVNNSWEKIQKGVKDTERLIGQKEYNAAMVKARQTLEFMVKILAERVGITETGDLMETIDALYQNHRISKATCEHYHKIRVIGNKAAHEGDENAYNANQAYHMLSQEVYTFANDYRNAQRGSSNRRPSSSSAQSSRSRKRSPQRKPAFTIYDLLKILIPVLCIVLLVLVFKLVKPSGDKKAGETTAPVTTEATTEAPSTEPATEATTAVYKTTTTVNVRPEPSTDTDRLGKLEPGTQVEFVRTHDNDWSVILYNGQEAYVSSQYLTAE